MIYQQIRVYISELNFIIFIENLKIQEEKFKLWFIEKIEIIKYCIENN